MSIELKTFRVSFITFGKRIKTVLVKDIDSTHAQLLVAVDYQGEIDHCTRVTDVTAELAKYAKVVTAEFNADIFGK